MIHIKAIAAGSLLLSLVLGAGWIIAAYPMAGIAVCGIASAYCLGRAALSMIPTKRS